MKKLLLILIITNIYFYSCSINKNNIFLIGYKKVGKITDSTKVSDLKNIFNNKEYSISKKTEGEGAFEAYDEYTVTNKKTNEKLLTIIPQKTNDKNSVINQVEILNSKFVTDKGINLNSNFGKIKKAYKINRIDKTFKYLVIYLDEINATIDIDKKVLPLNIQNTPELSVDITMIPDDAKPKHLVVFLNE